MAYSTPSPDPKNTRSPTITGELSTLFFVGKTQICSSPVAGSSANNRRPRSPTMTVFLADRGAGCETRTVWLRPANVHTVFASCQSMQKKIARVRAEVDSLAVNRRRRRRSAIRSARRQWPIAGVQIDDMQFAVAARHETAVVHNGRRAANLVIDGELPDLLAVGGIAGNTALHLANRSAHFLCRSLRSTNHSRHRWRTPTAIFRPLLALTQ